MPREINRTLITLIPKCENANSVKDYRPIACCTVLYKVISKVLANRMQGVLDTIICENQSAFVKGRLIFDKILLSHELVKGYQRNNISPRCMVKVDLQKAYDSVEWPFLRYLMLYIGFPAEFVQWIMSCVTTVSYTINVNGELTIPFEARKGLRQGDPLSPYLFVLCMEYLNRCLVELHEDKLFKFHPRCKKYGLTHVCFADDLLMFTRGDLNSIQQLMKAFRKFSAASGLQENQMKSCVYFGGVAANIRQNILTFTGMIQGQLPFKYLGVPLSSQKLSILQCSPLIKRIMARIECWASKLLSYAGRLQLIKSVLFGVQVYWSQVFMLPQKVMKYIQTSCRTFLWTGRSTTSKRALVAWDKLCLPKSAGGLNLINMRFWNKAAICKMLWNLAQKKDKLWVRWVHGYYVKNSSLHDMNLTQQSSWVIRKIIGAREYLRELNDGKDWLGQTGFSIRKLYQAFCGDSQRVTWSKLVCHNYAPPKCVFISWLIMHDSLATCVYLSKIGVTVDQNCCFCGNGVEDMNHLFFGCMITGRIWQAITLWCGLNRNPEIWLREREFLVTQCRTKNGKQTLYRSVFSVVTYMVWKERNARRMQQSQMDIGALIQQCKILICWCCNRDSRLARLLDTAAR